MKGKQMIKSKFLLSFLLLFSIKTFVLAIGTPEENQKRGMVPEDYYNFVFVSGPQISPDGKQIAFVVSKVSEDRRSRESSIWMVPSDGSREPTQFTRGPRDSSPEWSPDGKHIAFLSPRGEKNQVCLISTQGGESFPLTDLEAGVSSFQWSPDGKHMLLVARTEEEAHKSETADKQKEGKPDIKVIKRSKYKANGVPSYLDEKRSHLWVFDIASKKATQITRGQEWNDSDHVWSPDGKQIAFVSDRTGKEYEGSPNTDIWVISAEGGPLKQITTQSYQDTYPQWSPDGRAVAYLRTDDPHHAKPEIYIVSSEGNEHRCLTCKADRNPSRFKWFPDGRYIYFIADDLGSIRPFRLDVQTGRAEKIDQGPVSISNLSISKDGSLLAFTLEDERRLPEIWVSDASWKKMGQITHFNTPLLQSLKLAEAEEYWFTNDAGIKVHCFLFKPINWQPGKKYPLILNIHGGFSAMWGHLWFHEFQMLAAKDFAVFVVNYRGSTGYGHDFQKALKFDYGGADYQDNIKGLDYILKREEWIDNNRLGVTGGSWGGFLTNWIITQTDRFKAAVTQRSISNWISIYGQQDLTPQEMRIQFNGTPWENHDLYWDRSPIKYADRIKTPTLIIHSDQDYRCPLGQAQELFYALKIHGVPTEMVIFQGENHNLSRTGKPVNLVERLKRLIDWFERYL